MLITSELTSPRSCLKLCLVGKPAQIESVCGSGHHADWWLQPSLTVSWESGAAYLPYLHQEPFWPWPLADGPRSSASAECCPQSALDTAKGSLRIYEGATYAGRAYMLQQSGIANTCFSYARNLWLVLNAIQPGFLPRNIPVLHNLPVAGRGVEEQDFTSTQDFKSKGEEREQILRCVP